MRTSARPELSTMIAVTMICGTSGGRPQDPSCARPFCPLPFVFNHSPEFSGVSCLADFKSDVNGG